ncbi:hypothetical protein HN681_03065 [archaeon]|nr:hypothetical protein [archaeon]MBT3731240.1 hypothetical protein [archaeon]MBT4670006.1 hypothetical protein [archaeon]MBT5287792.1 hypothetical protein [archaeon]MBT7052797.1 hypothetical protein [archaeon]
MSLIKLAEDMVDNYESFKYSDMVSLHWFVRCWDQEKNDFVPISSEGKNDYYDSFFNFVEKIRIESGEGYKRSRMGVAIGLEKFQFYADVHKNYPLIRNEFIERIEEPLKEEVENILFDVPLILESANSYIDYIYRAKKRNGHFNPARSNLEYFLRHFDIEKKGTRKRPRNSYIEMWQRLGIWPNIGQDSEDTYFERLKEKNENLHNRLSGVIEDIRTGDWENQERLKMLEFLVEKGAEGIIDTFGPESYDLLVAIYGPEKFPEERRFLLGKKPVRKHLATCRRDKPPVERDWETDMIKSLRNIGMKPKIYEDNLMVQRYLRNRFIAPYLDRYFRGDEVLDELKGKQSSDFIERKLIEFSVQHFERIEKLRELSSIKKSLRGIRIRG